MLAYSSYTAVMVATHSCFLQSVVHFVLIDADRCLGGTHALRKS